MTNYQAALQHIHSLERFGIVPGLERVAALCQALGNPQNRLRFVHVAGTNGKGSTCAMLAQILAAAGLRTGLFTSPYVTSFRERMQVNGAMIAEEDVAALTERLRGIPVGATEFEFVTAMAFEWFARRRCDIVVLEVGLGGRFDATNLIPPPLCSVITKIALDHTQVLGDTLEKIAFEKCGIVKAGSPVVVSCEQPPQALAVVTATAKARGCPCVCARLDECVIQACTLRGSRAVLAGLPVFVPPPGEHMCRNALTAVHVARLLGISDEAIQAGIARAALPARMEVLSQAPLVLLDGGHNPDGGRALAAALAKLAPNKKFLAICGMMADKDATAFLAALRPAVAEWITCQPDNPRALSAEALAGLVRQTGQKATAAGTVEGALRQGKGHHLFICGSFYLAGQARGQFAMENLQ
jgi:dihydrofolate synthase/folylpolyglutamate synthase